MATLTIRDLEPDVRDRLRVRAAKSGRSMEEEVRVILRQAVENEDESNQVNDLAERIHARFAPLGGLELELPSREPMPEPIKFK
jgi:plasmid stability protein